MRTRIPLSIMILLLAFVGAACGHKRPTLKEIAFVKKGPMPKVAKVEYATADYYYSPPTWFDWDRSDRRFITAIATQDGTSIGRFDVDITCSGYYRLESYMLVRDDGSAITEGRPTEWTDTKGTVIEEVRLAFC